jgi:tripartite-type tricarboxylate transporter receptor subunit TctC
MNSTLRRIVFAIALVAPMSGASAQVFPDRPIHFVIGFGVGGPTDIVARTLADQMSEMTGMKVIVEPKPGASGNIATQAVASAPPDGYTYLIAASPLAVNETLFRDLPVKYGRDLIAVAPIGATANALVVHPAMGVRSLAEFIALVRARPGVINYATLGNGSSSHLAGATFDLLAGTTMVPVAYRAGADALRDLMGGTIQAWFATIPSVLEQARAGRLVALATTGPERSTWLPDLPTVGEAAFPGYDVRLWLGLFAPAATPPDRIQTVEQAVNRVMASPDMRKTMDVQGVAAMTMSRGEFDRFVVGEVERWKGVVEKLKLPPP